jgi:5'-3' exonuclease
MAEQSERHIVFLDLSYVVIHRYFAVVSWCKMTKIPLGSQEEMFAMFAKGFETKLISLKHEYNFEWTDVFLVKDTPRDTIWRNRIFPDYKANRDASGNRQAFDTAVFPYTYDVLIPRLQEKYSFHVKGFQTAEGDDCIAVGQKMARRADPSVKIIIVTNDNDFVQLTNNDPNTIVVNANRLELRTKFDEQTLSVFLQWKIIKGDKSDNIPAIAKKIGDKTALRLAIGADTLLVKKFKDDPASKLQYDMNETLMSFDCIPADIVAGIEGAFEGHF